RAVARERRVRGWWLRRVGARRIAGRRGRGRGRRRGGGRRGGARCRRGDRRGCLRGGQPGTGRRGGLRRRGRAIVIRAGRVGGQDHEPDRQQRRVDSTSPQDRD